MKRRLFLPALLSSLLAPVARSVPGGTPEWRGLDLATKAARPKVEYGLYGVGRGYYDAEWVTLPDAQRQEIWQPLVASAGLYRDPS